MKKESRIGDLIVAIIFCIVMLMVCKSAEAQVIPEYNAFPKASVGLQLGTQGPGVQASYRVYGAFNVRVGLNTVPNIEIKYDNRQLLFNRTSVYTIVDWQPHYGSSEWWDSKWFVSAGLAYYFSNSVYRQGITGVLENYSIYMAKTRPYLGTGLGNLHVGNHLLMRADLGYFIPLSSPTSTLAGRESKVSSGLKGILPGLNAGITFYIKF